MKLNIQNIKKEEEEIIKNNKEKIVQYIKDLDTIREDIKNNFINMKDFRKEEDNPIIKKLYDDHLSEHLGFLKHFTLIAAINKIKSDIESIDFTIHRLEPSIYDMIIKDFFKNKDLFPEIIIIYTQNEINIMKHEKARYKFIYYLKSYLIFIKFFLSINKDLKEGIDKFHKDYAKEIHLDVFNESVSISDYRYSLKNVSPSHFNYFKYLKIVDSLNNQYWRTLYYYFHNRHYITQEESDLILTQIDKSTFLDSEDKVKQLIKELKEIKRSKNSQYKEDEEELNTRFIYTTEIEENITNFLASNHNESIKPIARKYKKHRKILEVEQEYIITIQELCDIVTDLWKLLNYLIENDKDNNYQHLFKDLFILFFGNDGDNLANYMGLNGMQVSDISDILYLSYTTGVQNIRLKGIPFPPKNQKK